MTAGSFKKINKIDKPLVRLKKKERSHSSISGMKWDILQILQS